MERFDSFENTGLKPEIKRALKEMGFTNPTEVQAEAIPYALEGKDLIVRSKTGSGKTGAFGIPMIEMLTQQPSRSGVHAVIIAPTRELALQISDVLDKLGKYTHVRSVTVYGGVSLNPQAERIRMGAAIVVGTPGRIIDLMERGMLDLSKVKFLVLDEADIMLEMGFIDDIKYIMENMPEKKQMMLFSATMPNKIKEVAYEYMHNIKTIEVGGEEEFAVKRIQNLYALVSKSNKFSTLLAYMEEYKPKKAIIFSKTQRNTETLFRMLSDNGYKPIILHGGMTQAKREMALGRFRRLSEGVLVSTNVAARGLDIVDISDVINFDSPDEPAIYLHRVGRSARMGKEGRAFTIVQREENSFVYAVEKYANIKFNRIDLDTEKFKGVNFGKYFGGRDSDRPQYAGRPNSREHTRYTGKSYHGGFGGSQDRGRGYDSQRSGHRGDYKKRFREKRMQGYS
ncbi:MAG: DEAD/DEAH box helicase [Candidatus Marsarchaeota archaeon]|nr:DEAD/DEAH box helicase [Candidatus Marsarchaeota archaeon]